jgi:uncharacterized protein YdaU (DUF1376 family)
MKNPPSIQFYPKDYLADANVRMLSFAQRGVYMDLLCFCWENDGLPLDHELISRLIGLPKRETKSILPSVLSLFCMTDTGYHHERLLKQKDLYNEKRVKAQESASKRWRSSSNANAMRTHMPTHCEGNAIIGVADEVEVEEEKLLDKLVTEDRWQKLVDEEFQKLWEDFPKKKGKMDAIRAFRKAVGKKEDLPRLICICLCMDKHTAEMVNLTKLKGSPEMVTRFSDHLNNLDYETDYDDFYPEALAQAEEIINRPATDLRDEIKNA